MEDETALPIKLYTYYRSSCAFRVRIALELKELEYEAKYINLGMHEDEQADYLAINPQGLVPTLFYGQRSLTQSLAIIEYLEECYPEPALLPATARDRARVRALAQIISSDIQPLNNKRVLSHLQTNCERTNEQQMAWYEHWLNEGFSSLEKHLSHSPATGTYCHGDMPTLADICLVPQIYNALRYDFDMTSYPEIQRIYDECLWLDAFRNAAPENQPDAEDVKQNV